MTLARDYFVVRHIDTPFGEDMIQQPCTKIAVGPQRVIH